MKRNPKPSRMFCSFFFSLSHSPTHPQTHQHTQRERRERREKRDVCAIALIANEGAAIQGGVGWGERKGKERNTYTHTHGNGWMDVLRCAALQWMRCNGKEMGRDFAVVVSCLFLLLLFERARLIGAAAAAAIAGCWLSKFTIRMQCNGIEVK